jgi:hypothetical protein
MSSARLGEEAVATGHLIAFLDQRVDFEAGVDERQPLDLGEQRSSILSLAHHLVAEVAGHDAVKKSQVSRLPRPQVVEHDPLTRGASFDHYRPIVRRPLQGRRSSGTPAGRFRDGRNRDVARVPFGRVST